MCVHVNAVRRLTLHAATHAPRVAGVDTHSAALLVAALEQQQGPRSHVLCYLVERVGLAPAACSAHASTVGAACNAPHLGARGGLEAREASI